MLSPPKLTSLAHHKRGHSQVELISALKRQLLGHFGMGAEPLISSVILKALNAGIDKLQVTDSSNTCSSRR